MDLPLRLAVAPRECEARFHRIVIFFQSGSEALEFWDALFFHSIKPGISAFALSLSQHVGDVIGNQPPAHSLFERHV